MRRIVLSPGRTSSQALQLALSEDGLYEVDHVHVLSAKILEEKASWFKDKPVSSRLVYNQRLRSELLSSSREGLRIATCVRDPVGQVLSQCFKFVGSGPRSFDLDAHDKPREAAARLVNMFHRNRPLTFFEDNVEEVLKLNIFSEPFDLQRGSIQLDCDGLKMIVVRFEDETAVKEAALGWLIDKPALPLRPVDRTSDGPLAAAYVEFCRAFSPPKALLDEVYGSRFMRHFYTEQERQALRRKWELKAV